MANDRRVRVLVSGDVQGVFFRTTTEDQARELGVTGWVKNRGDGRVEAEFQGPPDAVDRAVDFCRQGPGRAHVTDVEISDIDPVEGESGFQVR
ncbi:MAG TPA: acylphosphatase [Egibacteraceae bacterium]|nr:acylphosphatase [Actinomycetota bacterium]HWB71744.1 acylphosphatase [Egibacteraceae bacterium]